MNTFRSLIRRKGSGKGRTAAPAVIHLPDANAPAARPKPAPKTRFALSAKAKTLRNRALGVIAVLAVPAMAAPGDFGALPGAARGEESYYTQGSAADAPTNPQPFEQPGMSFPGSAFFFLADPPPHNLIALPTSDPLSSGTGEAGRELGAAIDAGPAAQPFFSVAGTSHMRAEECLAQAIWYEAASESEAGQRAVAQVVLNRVAHANWPGSVCGVVYQGSQRVTGCQFTFTCDGSLRRNPRGRSWDRARAIAGEALSGSVYEPIGHATHYHTLWVNPYWASSLDHVGTIGAHRFYRNRGAAGRASAFTGRYAGVEPGVSERGRSDSGGAQSANVSPASAAPARSNSAGASRAIAGRQDNSAAITPAPNLADPSYSGVGQVREDYARAGQWKSDAARAALEADAAAIASEAAAADARIEPEFPAP